MVRKKADAADSGGIESETDDADEHIVSGGAGEQFVFEVIVEFDYQWIVEEKKSEEAEGNDQADATKHTEGFFGFGTFFQKVIRKWHPNRPENVGKKEEGISKISGFSTWFVRQPQEAFDQLLDGKK